METFLSPALGFDIAAGRAKIYGSGLNKVSWISAADVAALAAEAVRCPAVKNAALDLGGPEALSPLEVVRRFEARRGWDFEVENVSEAELRRQRDAAPGG